MPKSRSSAKDFPKARDKSKDKKKAGRKGGKRSVEKRRLLKELEGTDTGFLGHPYGGGESMRISEAMTYHRSK